VNTVQIPPTRLLHPKYPKPRSRTILHFKIIPRFISPFPPGAGDAFGAVAVHQRMSLVGQGERDRLALIEIAVEQGAVDVNRGGEKMQGAGFFQRAWGRN
jgi:hypothetical protein